jgi:large subunit ribosomal protein L21
LIVFKYKSKKRYRHKRGHRQELTFLTVDDIVADGKSLVTGKAPEFKEQEALAAEEEEAAPVAQAEVEQTPEVEESVEEAPKPEPEKKTRRRRTAKAEESSPEAEE